MAHFFGQGMFDDFDKRYFRLIDRSGSLGKEIRWESFPDYDPYDSFREVFFENRIGRQSLLRQHAPFRFRHVAAGLVAGEDRMSMAHGIESRTPFLDHPLVEFAATVPANVKFKDGESSACRRRSSATSCPPASSNRAGQDGFSGAAGRLAQGPAEADGAGNAVLAVARPGGSSSTTRRSSRPWPTKSSSAARSGVSSASNRSAGNSSTDTWRSRVPATRHAGLKSPRPHSVGRALMRLMGLIGPMGLILERVLADLLAT